MRFKFVFKLILVLSLVGISPLILNSFLSFSVTQDSLEKLTFLNLERMNELASFEVESLMAQAFDNIAVLSRNPILISKETSVEEKKAELEKIYRYYSLFKDITILNKHGGVIISTTYLFYGEWKANFWFSEAKRTKSIVASNMYAIHTAEKPIMAFISPILDEKGEIDFFIVAQLDIDFLRRILDFKIGEQGYAILTNSLGDIIFHPQESFIFEEISPDYSLKENTLLLKGITKTKFQNENFITSFNVIKNYKNYPGHGWHLLLVQPEKEAFALVNKLRNQIYVFLISSFLIILPVVFFLVRHITQPLKKLTIGAKEVIAGNLKTQVEIKTGDEFEDLAVTFNKMITDLGKSQLTLEEAKTSLEIRVAARTHELKELAGSLEGKVKERTKELQAKIDELERFQKLTIGRELIMVELKKEIKKMKEELAKYKPGSRISKDFS